MFDLILRGGHLVDPSQGIDARRDVAFSGGKVVAIGERIDEAAADTRDVSGLFVAPGLIDLHTHVYWGGTSIGVDAAAVARRGGTTTLVDAGSAGPGNFPGFRRHVIEPSTVRILAYLNISFPGIFAFSKPVMVGECVDIRLLDPTECVRVINEHRDLIVGVKVRVGRVASGANGVAPLDMAVEVAEETGLPVMAHLDHPPPSRKEVLSRLRPGDVLTHCFKPFPNAPLRSDGEVWEEVNLARERGVVFDLGHGAASFGFGVAKGMLAKGFVPDVISSDVHALNIDGPVFDLMATLSKFYCLGLDLATLVRTATSAPAAALRRPDLGSLACRRRPATPRCSRSRRGEFDFTDALGEVLRGRTSAGVPRDRADTAPGGTTDRTDELKGKTMSESNLVGGSKSDREQILKLHADYIDANARFDREMLDPIWSKAPEALFFNLNGHTYKGRDHWFRLWEFYGRNVQSSYWTPFDIGGVVSDDMAVVWCHRRTKRNWTGKEPPPKDIHYGGDEFITRSTMVFRKEAGEWRVVHTHFSEASAGARPGGV